MSGRRSLHDLNGNGVPDNLERKHGSSDRNGNGIPDKLEKGHSKDLNRNGIPDKLERGTGSWGSSDVNRNGIPDSLERSSGAFGSSDLNRNGIPDRLETMNLGTQGSSTYVSQVQLPTRIIQRPAAVHEEIRREQVEEIQPIVNVEKVKTEVHQVTQPLIDREVKPVMIQERVLASQMLPQINQPSIGMRTSDDFSTVQYRDTANIVVNKPAMVYETDRKQIIEEIQPVIYKETIVPSLIKETKQIYQTVVEGTTYVHETLPPVQLRGSTWNGRINTNDLNGNGIPDSLERTGFAQGATGFNQGTGYAQGTSGYSSDLNQNGIPDSLERRGGLGQDFNRNGIPDSLERRGGLGQDLNRNGVPDALERRTGLNQGTSDFNRNGIPDSLERRGGLNQDLNRNGVPDALEKRSAFSDRNGNGIPDKLEHRGSYQPFQTL